jgi:hypothetical protein
VLMKKIIRVLRIPALIGAATLCLIAPARAQETRKYEISAGYAHLRFGSGMGPLSMQGLNIGLGLRVNPWLSVVGDGGGYHTEGFRLATAQAGMRFRTPRKSRISGFAEVMVGLAHANAAARGLPNYHEGLAWTVGGGAELRINDRFSVRLIEADFMQTRLGGQTQNNSRVGAGIVVHFGKLE